MTPVAGAGSERAMVLAPMGRDAQIAAAILREAKIEAGTCPDMASLLPELEIGAGVALIVEEVLHEQDYGDLARWVEAQPPWSDLPVIVLAQRGGGIERNPAAGRFIQALGNVTFLERPFHPTTLVSIVQTALRGRRRQYEARDRLDTLRALVRRQQQDQAHLRLLINELNHRVKNTLATVQSIVTQTLRSAGASTRTRDTLTSRIVALSKAHDVLTNEQWSGADLGEIAAQAAQPFRLGLGKERIAMRGPKVRVQPKTAIAMALALHELATNAVKYGALSGPEGRVDFTWRTAGRGGARHQPDRARPRGRPQRRGQHQLPDRRRRLHDPRAPGRGRPGGRPGDAGGAEPAPDERRAPRGVAPGLSTWAGVCRRAKGAAMVRRNADPSGCMGATLAGRLAGRVRLSA